MHAMLRRVMRELVAEMRSLGVLEYSAPDGTRIVLGPEPHSALAQLADEQAQSTPEELQRRAHDTRWRRLTAATGAVIPLADEVTQ
jgi:hypothetical protein